MNKLIYNLLICLLMCQIGQADVQLNGRPISSSTGGIRIDSDENGSIDVVISSAGKVGIGELTPAANLQVSGNVYISGNVTLADTLEYRGSGKPKRSLILTAAGAIPAASAGATQTRVAGTNHTFYALDFDANNDESAYWHWIQPDSYDSGDIEVTLFWTSASTSNATVWAVQTKGIALGEAVDDTLSVAQTATATVQASANTLNITSFSAFASGWNAGDYIIFKIYRDADNAADTMAGDARLIKAKIEYAAKQESD